MENIQLQIIKNRYKSSCERKNTVNNQKMLTSTNLLLYENTEDMS